MLSRNRYVATLARAWRKRTSHQTSDVRRQKDSLALAHGLLPAKTGHSSSVSYRHGLTLVELLIVVGLLTVLASISLSAMRTTLRGNKVNQAALLVKQYLQNAQIRAITNGRPVAVFFDRISPVGDGANLGPANFTANRLQFGEVFPAYVGDMEGAVGKIETIGGMTNYSIEPFAGQLVFQFGEINDASKVMSGFGHSSGASFQEGFIKAGDLLEIEGAPTWFIIGDYGKFNREIFPEAGKIKIPFSNARINVPGVFTTSSAGATQLLPFTNNVDHFRRFKVYRQPTKSLVGAVSLPRGTCVDLSVSGLGPNDSSATNGALRTLDPPLTVSNTTPGDFSRIGIIFNSQGQIAYLLFENLVQGVLEREITAAGSNVYLMVGRTDQVLPGLQEADLRSAATSAGGDGVPPSNLMDPENVWVSCNPFTGEIKSSPVAAVELPPFSPANEAEANLAVRQATKQARRLAIAGVSN